MSVGQIQTSYHVRKLKNGNGRLFLYDFWSRYLEKLQFIHTETHQILNFGSQDISKEILSDSVRKDFVEFNDIFYYFEYAALEMLEESFNNYSMLKLRFFSSTTALFQCIVKTTPISIMQRFRTANHIFYCRIALK